MGVSDTVYHESSSDLPNAIDSLEFLHSPHFLLFFYIDRFKATDLGLSTSQKGERDQKT